jgi:hypothetical protein
MTPDEQSALARDQYGVGVEHGQTIADVIIKAFPSRTTRYVRRKTREILNQSFSNVQNKLLANGIEAHFRRPVAAGFIAGVKERDPELAAYLDRRVTLLG